MKKGTSQTRAISPPASSTGSGRRFEPSADKDKGDKDKFLGQSPEQVLAKHGWPVLGENRDKLIKGLDHESVCTCLRGEDAVEGYISHLGSLAKAASTSVTLIQGTSDVVRRPEEMI